MLENSHSDRSHANKKTLDSKNQGKPAIHQPYTHTYTLRQTASSYRPPRKTLTDQAVGPGYVGRCCSSKKSCDSHKLLNNVINHTSRSYEPKTPPVQQTWSIWQVCRPPWGGPRRVFRFTFPAKGYMQDVVPSPTRCG